MSVYAELADGRRLEFPDGTAPEVVQSTVKKLLASAPQTEQAPEIGAGEAALIAAGRGTDKVVQGVKQLYYGLKSKVESPDLSTLVTGMTPSQRKLAEMAADEADKDQRYQPLAEAHPVATGIGETAPSAALFPISGGASLVRAAVSAGLPSLLSYGTPEERAKRATVDAALGATGAKVGQLVGRVLKPAGVGVANVSEDALAAADRIGYKPTAAQVTQNPGMLNFENYLTRAPGSAGTMQAITTARQQAVNRAGAKAIGETADNLGEDVFASAKSRIGAEFDRLGQVTKPQIGDDFINALAKIEGENSARGSFANGNINKLIDKGLDLAAKGDLDGVAYKQIRTELSNQAKAAFNAGDATTGQAYKTVRDALDKAAKDSLSDSDKAAWDFARSEWSAFKTLSKSNVAEGGNVSAARTAAAVRSQNPSFRTGGMDGPLADIARVGEAFKSVPNPNSGNQMIGAMMGNPISALPFALGNRVAAAAYMNPLMQRYLAQGLVDVGPTGLGLLGRAGVQTALPAGRGLLGVE